MGAVCFFEALFFQGVQCMMPVGILVFMEIFTHYFGLLVEEPFNFRMRICCHCLRRRLLVVRAIFIPFDKSLLKSLGTAVDVVAKAS